MKKSFCLPQAFIDRLNSVFPRQAHTILTSYEHTRETTFRINRIKTDPHRWQRYMHEHRIRATRVSWYDDAYILHYPSFREFQETSAYTEGYVYVQNLSSMVPVMVLSPERGDKILDLCAAPGSKMTQIASVIGNEGEIVAVEKSKPRFYRMRANTTLQGVSCAKLVLADGNRLGTRYVDYFDKVLVDAPCSAEGRFHIDNPRSYSYWSTKKVNEMKRKQKRLLHTGWRMLKGGGRLVYATCTFSPEENEEVLTWFLTRHAEACEVVPLRLPFSNALPGLTQTETNTFHTFLSRTRRIMPNKTMEGFFVACLEKKH